MSYEPTIWKKGDKVTSTRLNKIENGIQGNDEEITSIKENLSEEEIRAKAEEARIEALFTAPTQEAVNNWLDEHPEATTTVQDGAITWAKLNDSVQEEIDGKAPVITGETTSVGVFHAVTNEHKVKAWGNSFTNETVKIANAEQLHIDECYEAVRPQTLSVTKNNGLINVNGTLNADIPATWVMTANRAVKIPQSYLGQTARFRIKSDKPCTIVQYANGSKPRITVRLRENGVTGDGRTVATIYFGGGLDNQIIDAYTDINIEGNDDIIYFLFQYFAAGTSFDDVNLYVYLYPTDAEVYDTSATLADGVPQLFDIPSGFTVVDTGVHQSALYGALDTKDYVDSHIPSNVVTTESLAEYIPNEKNLVYVTPEMFGAVGDATADDSTPLQDAIDYAVANNVAMRAFGHYKTMSPIVIETELANMYIHDIDYRGDGGAALILRGGYNYIRVDRIYTYFSTGAGFVMETTENTHTHYNEVHLGTIYAYTNGIECHNHYGTPATGNKHFYYNRIYIQQLYSRTANAIFLSANAQMNENSFWGKHITNGSGYFVYCDGSGANSSSNRFYEFCIESSSKNGVYGIAKLINCRTAECRGRKQAVDDDEGFIFVFDGVLPIGRAIQTAINYTSVDVTNARTYADCLDIVKNRYENGSSPTLAFDDAFPHMPTYIIGEADSVMTFMSNAMSGDYTMGGSIITYYNHKGFIPNSAWYYAVNVAEYYTWATDHSFPTIFDIKTNTIIHLDDSYCAIGIKQIKVIQTATEKATIYDHNNILVFDGTNLDAGTYILYCDLMDHETITVETSKGTITRESRALRGLYFGDNEKWTVEKLNIIS